MIVTELSQPTPPFPPLLASVTSRLNTQQTRCAAETEEETEAASDAEKESRALNPVTTARPGKQTDPHPLLFHPPLQVGRVFTRGQGKQPRPEFPMIMPRALDDRDSATCLAGGGHQARFGDVESEPFSQSRTEGSSLLLQTG